MRQITQNFDSQILSRVSTTSRPFDVQNIKADTPKIEKYGSYFSHVQYNAIISVLNSLNGIAWESQQSGHNFLILANPS